MDYVSAQFWFNVVQFLITGILGVYVYVVARTRATTDKIRLLEGEMYARTNRHADQLARLETNANHAPTHEDIQQINDSLSRRLDTLHGDIAKLSGIIEGLSRNVALMNEHLLNRERD